MKPMINERSKNHIVYALNGKSYFYETLFGTIHELNAESESLKERIKDQDVPRRFGFESGILDKKCDCLDTLVINCTESCNLNCGYCIYSGNYASERAHNNSGRMKEHIALRALDDFLAHSIDEPNITFYGGEPLLEKDLISKVIERAKQAKNKSPKYAMTTNLTLARESMAWLAANNMMITVSLDGPKEVHDKWRKYRNGAGSYDLIIGNLKLIERNFPKYFESKIAISATISSPEKLAELKCFFEGHPLISRLPLRMQSVERNFLSRESDVGKGFTSENLAVADSLFWEMAEAYCNKVAYGKTTWFEKALFDMPLYQAYTRSVGMQKGTIYPRGMCVPGVRKLFVDAKGDYYMCEKIGKRLKLGDVSSGLSKKKMEAALSGFCSLRQGVCGDCWAYKDCPSCAVSAKDIEGISSDGLKRNCGALEKNVFTGIALYTGVMALNGNAMKGYFKDYNKS